MNVDSLPLYCGHFFAKLDIRQRKKKLLQVGVVHDKVDWRSDGKVSLQEAEVLQHEGVIRHWELLFKADLDSRNDGHGGASPRQEDDDDHDPDRFPEQCWSEGLLDDDLYAT